MKKLGIIALFSTHIAFGKHCLGPEDFIANTPVGPRTCNGDITVSIAGIYWSAHQDGMEYAIKDSISIPVVNPSVTDLELINNLIDASYQVPNPNWEFGFVFGLGYVNSCDGWNFEINWTHFHTRSLTHSQAGINDNQILVSLFSSFSPQQGNGTFARDIYADWKLKLELVDFELGRNFWISTYVSIRPYIGLRYANIRQAFDLQQKGGSWSPRISPTQDPLDNFIDIDNDYRGVGLLSGLDTTWNFGCGWALLAKLSLSIIYGKFDIDHNEYNRLVIPSYDKTNILNTNNHFRASRAILDTFLGIQWDGISCECNYGIQASFGWENHLFFHQNQMWRVIRIGDVETDDVPNNTGENIFQQRRGNLDTQGWTLRLTALF